MDYVCYICYPEEARIEVLNQDLVEFQNKMSMFLFNPSECDMSYAFWLGIEAEETVLDV